jgi:hypothetical protein
LSAGYFAGHESLYNDVGYTIRRESLYAVTSDFPRLVPASLPQGIHSVCYVVELSAAAICVRDKAALFDQIGG